VHTFLVRCAFLVALRSWQSADHAIGRQERDQHIALGFGSTSIAPPISTSNLQRHSKLWAELLYL